MSDGTPRRADHAIDPLFLERHSPRAFTGEAVPEAELLRMIEAARWSPSAYNSQPWRFLYALRGDRHWDLFAGLISPGNRRWVDACGALVFLVSNSRMKVKGELKPSPSHSLDAGAASMAFQLQAVRQGWHAHGMSGFDRERAPETLNVPEHHRVEAAYGIGRKAALDALDPEQRERERPNGRRPIGDFTHAGPFPETEAPAA